MLDAGQSLARHIPINSPEIAVSSRMRLIPIVILAAIIAVAAGFFIRWQADQADAIPAGLARANGRIEAERVAVATKYAGRVAEILVKEGDFVERGAVIARMDTAGNGYVSKDEFLTAASTRFARMDSTGTGKLTLTQFQAAAPAGRGHWHGAAAAQSGKRAQFAQDVAQHEFDKLDANHDGIVSKDEYLAAAGTRFDALDTAHTGKLTAQQIAASPKMLRHDEFAAQHTVRLRQVQVLGLADLLEACAQALLKRRRELDRVDLAERHATIRGDRRRPDVAVRAARGEAPLPPFGMRVDVVEVAHRHPLTTSRPGSRRSRPSA